MTLQQASQQYRIPVHILKEYAQWELCGVTKKVMGDWQYDEEDLERFSIIMTLYDIGFTAEEVEIYMRLLLEQKNTEEQRLKMLEEKRNTALEEIRCKEHLLQRLDYLRHEIRKTQKQTGGSK